MRKVLTTKLDVKYVSDPYNENHKCNKWPLLFINNKLCELKPIKGIRPKYFYKNKFIVKFNDYDEIHDIKKIINLYKKIKKNGDTKYFPKLFLSDIKNKFIVQEYVPITTRGIKKVHRNLVKLLVQKYNLEDVSTDSSQVWNWAIHKKTKNVVIYDFVL